MKRQAPKDGLKTRNSPGIYSSKKPAKQPITLVQIGKSSSKITSIETPPFSTQTWDKFLKKKGFVVLSPAKAKRMSALIP
jgi:hypothetical protein